jgi:exonuclease III
MTLDLKDAIDLCKNYSPSLLTCNIQSFNKNHFSINSLISEIKPTFVSLQEIWSPKICMSLPDYHNPIMYTRTKKRGGGCSVLIHSSLKYEIFSPIEKISCKHIEKVVVKVIDSKCKNFLLISLYRPPKNKFFKDSLSELREVLEAAIKSNLPIILSGDLNIDLLQNDYFSIKYLELLQTFHLNQYIENATRFSIFKKSLIDHVVTTPGLEPIKAFPLCYPIADHLPTLTAWHESKVRIETSEPEKCKRINYKKLENLLRDRKSTDISSLDSNDSFDSLHDKILSSIDEATYLLPKRLRPKKS